MQNEALKHVIKRLDKKIVDALNTDIFDSIRDILHSKKVISDKDDSYLSDRSVSHQEHYSRYLFILVFTSSHPQAFVEFRLALLDKKLRIVEEIDDEVKSQSTLYKRLYQRQSTIGKCNFTFLFIVDQPI